MTKFEIVQSVCTESEKLLKKEAISVYSRWMSSFELNGPIDQIQSRILESSVASEAEAYQQFNLGKNERVYLLIDYNRPKMEAFVANGIDLEKTKDPRTDMVIIRTEFENCLVVNHEDGSFWNGPNFLKNEKAYQGASHNGDKRRVRA